MFSFFSKITMFWLFPHPFREIKLYCHEMWGVHLFACLPPAEWSRYRVSNKKVELKLVETQTFVQGHFKKDGCDVSKGGWTQTLWMKDSLPDEQYLTWVYCNLLSRALSSKIAQLITSASIIIKYWLKGNRLKEAANWVYNYRNMTGGKVAHQHTNKHVTSDFFFENHPSHLPWK